MLLVFCFISSCQQIDKAKTDSPKETLIEQSLGAESDSVVLVYWDNVMANEYTFTYVGTTVKMSSKYFSIPDRYLGEKEVALFIAYIDTFFVSKTKNFELSRKERPELAIADYPYLKVEVYKTNGKVHREEIQIGTETQEIEFQKDFLDFYKFLKKTTKQ